MTGAVSGVWELFEARLEAEDVRAPLVAARRLIERLLGDDPAMAAHEISARLEQLDEPASKALYGVLVGLTGGPAGSSARSPRERRLLALRLATSERLAQISAGGAQLTAGDVAGVHSCEPIDAALSDAVAALSTSRASDEIVTRLHAALEGYQRTIAAADLSAAGGRLLGWKVANVLELIGRAAATRHDESEAEQRLRAARDAFAAVGDEHAAERCAIRAGEAAQRRTVDVDHRLAMLLDQLDMYRPQTLAHAGVLVGLAGLAADQGDVFEANQRADQATAELTRIGYPPADASDIDASIKVWIAGVPECDRVGGNAFLEMFCSVLELYATITKVRLARAPDGDQGDQAILDRLAQVVTEMGSHVVVAEQRLDSRLAGLGVPGLVGPPVAPAGAVDAQRAGELRTEVMSGIGRLLDQRRRAVADGEEADQALTLADQLVAGARTLEDPVVTAQALHAQASLLLSMGQPADAIAPLQEAHALVAELGGATERTVATLALSGLMQSYAMTHNHERVSRTAGQAIQLTERDRYRVNAPFLQSAYLGAYTQIFAGGVFSAYKLQDYDTMLARAELSKAHASVRQLFAEKRSGSPSTREFDTELRSVSVAIHRAQAVGSPEVDGLLDKRRRLWDLRAIAHRGSIALPTMSVAAVQTALGSEEAALYYYWLGPTVLLIVTITAEAIEVERKLLSTDQRGLLDRFVDELSTLTGSNLSLDGSYITPLADVLLPQSGLGLLADKHRLVVSPHRLLHWFPFHALPLDGTRLVRRFAVRYIPNLTTLLAPPPRRDNPFVVELAVSRFPGREMRLPPLSTAEEAASIASIYQQRSIPVQVISEPTRERFLGLVDDGTLSRASCLHLATHGHGVSLNTPMESSLELSDGSLEGLELASLDLRCELVTISACDAGQLAIRGRGLAELPGDELFGLPAAFLQAGARCVLAPAWPAADDCVRAIIVALHRHLADGQPPDVALQSAQCGFLDAASSKEKRAYFWAPLFLLSTGRPGTLGPQTKGVTDG